MSSDESDTERALSKLSLEELKSKVYILRDQNKRYREELNMYRSMKTTSEDLEQMKILSDGIIKNLEIMKGKTCLTNVEAVHKETIEKVFFIFNQFNFYFFNNF